MTTNTVDATSDVAPEAAVPQKPRLPLVVYILALGTFLMLTTEFVVAGILPEVADDLQIGLGQAGSLITVFAVGMIIGAPVMAILTMRMSKRLTLVLALIVFILGHVIVALAGDLAMILVARFITAIATGAFWAVSAVVATRVAGPSTGARAIAIIGAGGSLAMVLGVPIGAFIAQLVGWRGTFWFLAAAAAIAIIFIARLVPKDDAAHVASSVRTQLAGLRSGRLWLVLLACATTTGGVLAAYTYISPILTEQASVPYALVPLVLTGFGIGSFVGTILGGRFGDRHPGRITIVVPAVTALLLVGISFATGAPFVTIVLVVILGLFGLSANGVLIHLAVTHAGEAATLGSALAVSAFNVGTAIGTAIAGIALATPLGTHGPAIVGAVIVTFTLIPTIGLAVMRRRAAATATV
ncbi:MFS transporter [Conyzicola sp.]|uniref:MFS transporter n=1 Tax=Conyzicola sp. TaxID=1969404 RepID=UPI003988B87F